jgi:hypothetical protein
VSGRVDLGYDVDATLNGVSTGVGLDERMGGMSACSKWIGMERERRSLGRGKKKQREKLGSNSLQRHKRRYP